MSDLTAEDIAACLARGTFKDSLCVVDRCYLMGDEADLLVLHPSLRVIDVEIKTSRADLRADRRKDKWYEPLDWGWSHRFRQVTGRHPTDEERLEARRAREWPRGVWKHYYALPLSVWRDDLLNACGPASGVLVITPVGRLCKSWRISVKRYAKPNRSAASLSHSMVARLARLASLRMWDAYEDRRSLQKILDQQGASA